MSAFSSAAGREAYNNRTGKQPPLFRKFWRTENRKKFPDDRLFRRLDYREAMPHGGRCKNAALLVRQVRERLQIVVVLRPGGVARTVLVEQRAALMIGLPGHRSMHQRLGEKQGVARLDFRLNHIRRCALEPPHFRGKILQKMALVGAGYAGEAPIALAGRR